MEKTVYFNEMKHDFWYDKDVQSAAATLEGATGRGTRVGNSYVYCPSNIPEKV